jgi:uncharacterized protein YwgA
MANLDKRLKNRELLLVVADAAGGKLDGRTIAQKLLYFSGLVLEQPTGHSAYFYGPYSDEFDAALNRAVLAGELSESLERIADWYGGPDAVKHVYELTEHGKAEASKVEESHEDEARLVQETITAIAEVVPQFRQGTLSAAAKINLIVSEQNQAVTLDELKHLAKELGWRLKPTEIKAALKVLTRLNLVEVHS